MIATRECNASKVIIFMNSIYIFPIGSQILKHIKACFRRKNLNANQDGYREFTDFSHSQSALDSSPSLLNIISLVISLPLAIGGLVYALYLQFAKVNVFIQIQMLDLDCWEWSA